MKTETPTATPNGAPARPVPIEVEVYQGSQANDFRARPPADAVHHEWHQRLLEILGSASTAFVGASLHRLLAACSLPGQGIPTSTGISAALALIESLHPENEIQAAVAVHIACLDAAASNMLSRVASHGVERRIATSASAAAKLERAFSAMIITYHRLKHGNRQVIRIERLEIQAGAQAVVGQVVGTN